MDKQVNPWTGEAVEQEASPITSEQMAEIKRQLDAYTPPKDREEWHARHGGVYARYSEKRLSKSSVARLFNRFLRYELRDYCAAHDLTLEDILRVGIEQFIVANGWRKVSQVATWRRNKIRLHVCPSCGEHFVPAMYQTNHGLCVHCRKSFSDKAIRGYIQQTIDEMRKEVDEQEESNEERRTSEPSFFVNFYILFNRDQVFRDLFRNGDPFAMQCEAYLDRKKQDPEDSDAALEM